MGHYENLFILQHLIVCTSFSSISLFFLSQRSPFGILSQRRLILDRDMCDPRMNCVWCVQSFDFQELTLMFPSYGKRNNPMWCVSSRGCDAGNTASFLLLFVSPTQLGLIRPAGWATKPNRYQFFFFLILRYCSLVHLVWFHLIWFPYCHLLYSLFFYWNLRHLKKYNEWFFLQCIHVNNN